MLTCPRKLGGPLQVYNCNILKKGKKKSLKISFRHIKAFQFQVHKKFEFLYMKLVIKAHKVHLFILHEIGN